MEYMTGRRPHKDGARDSRLCSQALHKLHDVGLVHGRVDCGNFVIRKGKKGDEAVLLDFAHTAASEHKRELLKYMADMEAMLDGYDRMIVSESDV